VQTALLCPSILTPAGRRRVTAPDAAIVTHDAITSSPRLSSLTSSNGEVLKLGWTGGFLTSLQSGPATAQHTVSWPTTGFDSALRPTQEQLDGGNTLTTGFDTDGFPLSTSDGSWTLTHHRAASGLVASAAFSNGSTTLHETFGHEASFGEPNDDQVARANQPAGTPPLYGRIQHSPEADVDEAVAPVHWPARMPSIMGDWQSYTQAGMAPALPAGS
jgi:hypothetical protein